MNTVLLFMLESTRFQPSPKHCTGCAWVQRLNDMKAANIDKGHFKNSWLKQCYSSWLAGTCYIMSCRVMLSVMVRCSSGFKGAGGPWPPKE